MNKLGKYFVYEPGTGRTSVTHDTREHAEREACRLIGRDPLKEFYVLCAVSVAHVKSPVLVTRVEDQTISEIIEQAKYADGDV